MSAGDRLKLDASWREKLEPIFAKPGMQSLREFLRAEKAAGKRIFPPGPQIFAALDATPFDRVKVVILGQDPYHGPGQAHGLCFSVLPGVPPPPSLANIFTELARDVGVARPDHGCLVSWARQGVLLLNTVLTVEQGRAGSHQGRGWEAFTDAIVDVLDRERDGLVFVLWGSPAQAKGRAIDSRKHLVLKSVHPSPLSAHRGFFGSGPFSKANEWLVSHGQAPIDWALPPRAEVEGLLGSPGA